MENEFPPPVLQQLLCDLEHSTVENSGVHVDFINLRDVYEKAQSRVNRKSRQRIIKGKVDMVVTFEAQIQDIAVMVEKIPEARGLANDRCGQVALKVKFEKLELNKVSFVRKLCKALLALSVKMCALHRQ